MHYTKTDLESMERIYRLNLVNSLSGFKSANLVGTKSSAGISNLSIVSSVIHLSSSPAVIGFVQRPTTVPRHTYRNIHNTGYYTLNQVHQTIIDRAHYTSAKFEEEISEFDAVGLGEEYLSDSPVPFVKESRLKMLIRYQEEYSIQASNTIMIVGSIEFVQVSDDAIRKDGSLDMDALASVCISGLNSYHSTKRLATFPYARPGQFPEAL
jgi:flavin reductase (DIM6/NTAB) family NADH-FMN oxidoreductase RutF